MRFHAKSNNCRSFNSPKDAQPCKRCLEVAITKHIRFSEWEMAEKNK